MNVVTQDMVEVFKTNVQEQDLATHLTHQLLLYFPHCKINFDLQDCDNVLRVEGYPIQSEKIIEIFAMHGYTCEILE
jgi:hypothetical protein